MTVTFASSPKLVAPPECHVYGVGVFKGQSRTYSFDGWQGLLNTVVLAGLKPATSYTYNCGNRNTTFSTAPEVGTLPVRIAAVGDLGSKCDDQGCGNATIDRLGDAARAGAYSLLLHIGDIAYTNGRVCLWDNFFRNMEPVTARVPYMVAVGNHEHYYNFSGYRERFVMPGDGARTENLWYSFNYGGVHVAAFSTEHDLEPQAAWLREDLARAAARRAQVPWIVVMAHRPMYCSTDDYYDCELGSHKIAGVMEGIIQEASVDLFLAGHLHNYERAWPVFNGTVTAKSYVNPGAPVHLVIGMAGDVEGLTDKWLPAPAWRATKDARLGYAMLDFQNASTMRFEYILSDTGAVADSFVLEKNRAPPVVAASAEIVIAV